VVDLKEIYVMKRIYVKGSKLVRVVKTKTIKAYIISAVIIIAAILIAARFVHGGVAYKYVSLICYGFLMSCWPHTRDFSRELGQRTSVCF
jgi:hypothetical protein